jgi:hypothetical protein
MLFLYQNTQRVDIPIVNWKYDTPASHKHGGKKRNLIQRFIYHLLHMEVDFSIQAQQLFYEFKDGKVQQRWGAVTYISTVILASRSENSWKNALKCS